jgi:hypothetical protein
MVSDSLKQHAISGLREARADLLAMPKEALTYQKLNDWLVKWVPQMQQAESVGGSLIRHNSKYTARGTKPARMTCSTMFLSE